MDSVVTSSQQHPQTLKDGRTTKITVKPQAPPQEKNIQSTDEIAEARNKNKSSNP